MTAVANSIFTAAQFNTHVRDNLNETAPAKATAASRWFVSHGLNDMREREINGNTVGPAEPTTSTAYTNLATFGADVTIFTGVTALVWTSALLQHNTAGAIALASYEVASATTISANDLWAIRLGFSSINDDMRAGIISYRSGLNNGGNIFRMKYRTTSGTATFAARHIMVMGL